MELPPLSRYQRKLSAMGTSEINGSHKILSDGSTKLRDVVGGLDGVSA